MRPLLRAAPGLAMIAALAGCVTMPGAEPEAYDPRQCAQNFSVEGSPLHLSGTRYQTSVRVPSLSRKEAIERATRQIALEGLTLTRVDSDSGLITAANRVISGKSETVPLIVTVDQLPEGVGMQLKFIAPTGMVTTEGIIRKGFCNIATAVEQR